MPEGLMSELATFSFCSSHETTEAEGRPFLACARGHRLKGSNMHFADSQICFKRRPQ